MEKLMLVNKAQFYWLSQGRKLEHQRDFSAQQYFFTGEALRKALEKLAQKSFVFFSEKIKSIS